MDAVKAYVSWTYPLSGTPPLKDEDPLQQYIRTTYLSPPPPRPKFKRIEDAS